MTFDRVAVFLPGFYDETLRGLLQIPSRKVSVYIPRIPLDTTLSRRMTEATRGPTLGVERLDIHPTDVKFFTVIDPIRLLTREVTLNSWFVFKSIDTALRGADAALIDEPHTFFAAQVMKEARRQHIPVAVYTETSNNVVVSSLFPYGTIAKRVIHLANHCIAGTPRAEEYLLAKGADATRLSRQPLPFIDVTRFHPGPKQSEGNLHILFVGRLEPFKGIDTLLGAMDKLGRSLEMRLTVVGEGSLERLLLEDHPFQVTHHRFLPGSSYAEVFRSANVFCAPPREVRRFNHVVWEEVLGIAPLEAMASGLACIFSRCGNLPDLAVDGTPLFEPGNVPDLVRAIEEYALDPSRIRRASMAGQDRVARMFEPERIAQGWIRALT